MASAPAVVFGILIIPLFDTLRIFIIRTRQGKSPFQADRQHIHHRLLQLGLSHFQSTMVLVGANVFFIAVSFVLRNIGIIWLTLIILGLASVLSFVVMSLVRQKEIKAQMNINPDYSSPRLVKDKKQMKDVIHKKFIYYSFLHNKA